MLLTDIMSDEWNPNMKRRLIKNKSDRKRRKVSAIRQQHNLIANRARDIDEEKRRRDRENQRLARQRNPKRRAAAHRARDLERRAAVNRASYQEGLMFTVNSFIFATSIACSFKQF